VSAQDVMVESFPFYRLAHFAITLALNSLIMLLGSITAGSNRLSKTSPLPKKKVLSKTVFDL
jgi:hypothetical protein